MTIYTVTGHPLNYANTELTGTDADNVRAALMTTGVGQTINVTLSGAHDTKIKGHGVLR
jgi:hypothetical protein